MADAGTSLDGRDEDEESEHGALSETSVGLERLVDSTLDAYETHILSSFIDILRSPPGLSCRSGQACLSESRDWSSCWNDGWMIRMTRGGSGCMGWLEVASIYLR
jgi:hypothetical protein